MRFFVLLPLLAGLVTLAWWWPNRPVDPEPGVAVGRFESLSFAPFRDGQSPLRNVFPTEAQADADMALLAPRTEAVRTYAALGGGYDVAALARRHGMKLWQGIWLGGDRAQNAREMARGIALAWQYPETITRLVVGNEVLLRRDLPPAELIADIDQVRAAVTQPVAYADVWSFWEQFPQVAAHVDVMLIHLLPYWEDVPTGIDGAVAHVGAVYDHMTALFPGKRIGIGETGWPSRGRQRRDAVPGAVNEARFLRQFIALSRAKHFDYNFIEAFDQTWKYESEGVVGANWGLLDADRAVKIPLAGPLEEDPRWRLHAGFSVGMGLLLTAMGLAGRARGSMQPAGIVTLGMALGVALGFAQAGCDGSLYDIHARMAAAVNLGGQASLAVLAMLRAAGSWAPRPERNGADATASLRALLRLQRPDVDGAFEDLGFVFAWTAAVLQLLLVFDPRYRDFPTSSFVVPLLVILFRAVRRELPRGGGGRAEWVVAGVLVAGAVASAVQEGALNGQSLLWNACALGIAAPLLLRLTGNRAPTGSPAGAAA